MNFIYIEILLSYIRIFYLYANIKLYLFINTPSNKYNSKEILPIKDNILDSKSFISIKIDIIIIENMIIDIV